MFNLREIANQGNNKKPNIEPGDIVLLKNDRTKRCFWKLGKVVELLLGRDGNIRAAKVKVPSARGTTVLSRPLQLLIPLEIRSQVEIDPPGMPQAVTNQEQADTRTRPRRNAAVIGEILRKDRMSIFVSWFDIYGNIHIFIVVCILGNFLLLTLLLIT